MAAAYLAGNATDPTDLLNQIATFLVAQGWTQDSNVTDGAGKRAHLHKGSDYVNLRSAINEAVWPNLSGTTGYGVHVYMGTAYSGASGWAAQTGGPKASGTSDTVGACMELGSGAITAFHFFDDGSDNIVVVVERSGGKFTHIGFGRTFTKAGTWTGGAYFFGAKAGKFLSTSGIMGDPNTSAPPPFGMSQPFNVNSSLQNGCAAFVRVDVDSFTSKWVGFSCTNSSGTGPQEGYTGKLGHSGIDYNDSQEMVPTDFGSYARLQTHLVSAFNAQAVLLPIFAYAQRDAGGWSMVGQAPNVFVSHAVDSGQFGAGTIQTVNGKNYMLFPRFAVRKFA